MVKPKKIYLFNSIKSVIKLRLELISTVDGVAKTDALPKPANYIFKSIIFGGKLITEALVSFSYCKKSDVDYIDCNLR